MEGLRYNPARDGGRVKRLGAERVKRLGAGRDEDMVQAEKMDINTDSPGGKP